MKIKKVSESIDKEMSSKLYAVNPNLSIANNWATHYDNTIANLDNVADSKSATKRDLGHKMINAAKRAGIIDENEYFDSLKSVVHPESNYKFDFLGAKTEGQRIAVSFRFFRYCNKVSSKIKEEVKKIKL
jgi:hypothetical protein